MLRKRKKFIKAWMLFYWAVVAIVFALISIDVLRIAFAIVMGVLCVAIIVLFIYECVTINKSKYKTACKYFLAVRRRLFCMGYNVIDIFGDSEEYVSSLNYRLLQMTEGKNELTSIDVATAIIHSIVAENDGKEFIYDVFRCVKDNITYPRRYRVSYTKDVFVIEDVVNVMEKPDFETYINCVGVQDFKEFLKNMYTNDPSLKNPYLWYVYNNALD